jgi:hypothetical protein
METAELQAPSVEHGSRTRDSVVTPPLPENDLTVGPFEQLLGGAAAEPQGKNANRLLRKASLSYSANHPVRALVFKRAQQARGNRFTQSALSGAYVQRHCSCGGTCEACRRSGEISTTFNPEEEPALVQRQAQSPSEPVSPDSHESELIPSDSGQPMNTETRAFMEPRFDADFSDVRIHTDSRAAQSADRLQADAYTSGRNIYFAAGQYAPATRRGQHLLAHELTHTIQQRDLPEPAVPAAQSREGVLVSQPDDPLEQEADRTADLVINSESGVVADRYQSLTTAGTLSGSNPSVSRAPISNDRPIGIARQATPVPAQQEPEDEGWLEGKIWGLLEKYVPNLVPILRRGPGGVFDWIKEKVIGAIGSFVDIMMAPVRAIGSTGKWLQEHFEPLLTWMQDAATKIAHNDCGPITEAAQKIEELAAELINPVIEKLRQIADKVGGFLKGVWEKFGAPAWEFIKNYAGQQWDQLQKLGEWIWDKAAPIRELGSRAWTWLKNKIGIGEGPEGQNGILQWIESKASAAWDWVQAKLEPYKKQITAIAGVAAGIAVLVSPAGPVLLAGAAIVGVVQGVRWIRANLGNGDAIVRARTYAQTVLIPQLLGAISKTTGAVTRMANAISEKLGEFSAGLGQVVGAAAGTALHFLVEAAQWLADRANELAAWATGKLTALADWIHKGLERLHSFLQPVMDFLTKVGNLLADIYGLPMLVAGALWNKIPKCVRDPFVDWIVPLILRQIDIFKELVKDNEAWKKTKDDVMHIVRMVFVTKDLVGAIRATFHLILRAFNVPIELLMTVVQKAEAAWDIVVAAPIKFIKNCVRTVGMGLQLYWNHLKDNLLFGLEGWLFGELAEKGISKPQSWTDPWDVAQFVLSVMGLSINHLFDLMQKRFDKAIVDKLRLWYGRLSRVWDWITEIRSKKPAEVTAEIIASAKGFAKSIFESVVVWIVEKVSTELAEMAAAAAASAGLSEVLDAIRRVYRAIKTAVRWMRTILEMVNNTLDSVMSIAGGTLGPAAALLEGAMKRATPAVIGFLGDQVGLGGIADKIRDIIDDLREKVDEVILTIIDKLTEFFSAITGTGQAATEGTPGDVRQRALVMLNGELREEHTREEAQQIVVSVADRLRPDGLKSLTIEPEDESGVSQIVAEASPRLPLANLFRKVEVEGRVAERLAARITLDETTPDIGAIPVSPGIIPPVDPQAVASVHGQPAGGQVFERSKRQKPNVVELASWSTDSQALEKEGNQTHAERQFCEWIMRKLDNEFKKRKIHAIELSLKPYSPCSTCAGQLREVLEKIKEHNEGDPVDASLAWLKPWQRGSGETTWADLDILSKNSGWKLWAPATKSAKPEKVGSFAESRVTIHSLEEHPQNVKTPGTVQRKATNSAAVVPKDAQEIAGRGVETAASVLPHAKEIQESFGRHDIGATKAQIGGDATVASEAIGAKAYVHGDRVAFASSPDLHTAAHEAAHVVQQRAGQAPTSGLDTPGDALEQQADKVADAVVAGHSAEAVLDSIVVLPGAAATAVQREPETEKQRVGPTNPEYVNQHRSHILGAIFDRIAQNRLPHPHRRLYWAYGDNDNPVGAAISNYVNADPDQALKLLMMLSYPADLFEIVDAARRGPEGTRLEAVSLAVAIAFDGPLITSIRRMGPRFVVQLDLHGGNPPHASDLVASSPLDVIIAEVFVKPGSVHYFPPKKGAPDDTGGRPFAKGARNVQFEWLGSKDPALWNWIKVTAPPNPTVEDVAQTPFVGDRVLGGSEEAYRIAASPPYFGIPFETARLIPEAIDHAPWEVKAKVQTGPGPRVADPTKLGRSIVADEAALAQAPAATSSDPPLAQSVDRARVQIGFMLRTLEQLRSAFFQSQQKAFATRVSEAVKEEAITSEFLTQAAISFNRELSSWHLSDHLGGAIGFLNRRNHDLSLGKKLDSRWIPVLAGQERVLHAASSELQGFIESISTGGAKLGDAVTVAPIREVLEAYSRAAGVSHLHAEAPGALGEARRLRSLLPMALAEERVRAARATVTAQRETEKGAESLEKGAEKTPTEILQETQTAADLRAKALRGEPVSVDDIEKLNVDASETELRANLVKLATQAHTVMRKADDAGVPQDVHPSGAWSVHMVSEKIIQSVNHWHDELDKAHEWVGPRKGLSSDQTLTAQRREAIKRVNDAMVDLTKTIDFNRFLRDAYKEIGDRILVKAILLMVLQLGLMIATGELLGVAFVALRGLALAGEIGAELREASLIYKGAELIAQAGATTGIQAGFGEKVGGREFAENVLAAVLASTMLKPFRKWMEESARLEAGLVRQGGRAAAQLGLEGGAGIIASTVAHAVVHNQELKFTNFAPNDEWIVQGLSIVATRFVHKGTERMLERQKRFKAQQQIAKSMDLKETQELLTRTESLRERAAESKKPTAEEALAQLSERHLILVRERALYQDGRVSAKEVDQDLAATNPEFSDVPLRLAHLSPIVEGQIYEGSYAQIEHAFEMAQQVGAPITSAEWIVERGAWHFQAGDRVIEIRQRGPGGRLLEPGETPALPPGKQPHNGHLTSPAADPETTAKPGDFTPEQIDSANERLARFVEDPTKVREVTDPQLQEKYDIEVDLGDGQTYRRKKDGTWCLLRNPGICGTKVGSQINAEADHQKKRLAKYKRWSSDKPKQDPSEPRRTKSAEEQTGEPGAALRVRGQVIKPQGQAQVIVLSDKTDRAGRIPDPTARARVRAVREEHPDATLVVADSENSNAAPLVYPPGTQPPLESPKGKPIFAEVVTEIRVGQQGHDTEEVESTVSPEGDVIVTYDDRSVSFSVRDTKNKAKLVQGLGLKPEQATQVLNHLHSLLPEPKLLISFAIEVGNPRDFLLRSLRDPTGKWESDAFERPPGEGTRLEARIGRGEARLSEYALVFEESVPNQFTPKTSGTTAVTEFQYVDPNNPHVRIKGAKVVPRAVVRVDEHGQIVEIVGHTFEGPPDKQKADLRKLLSRPGWKVKDGLL